MIRRALPPGTYTARICKVRGGTKGGPVQVDMQVRKLTLRQQVTQLNDQLSHSAEEVEVLHQRNSQLNTKVSGLMTQNTNLRRLLWQTAKSLSDLSQPTNAEDLW